MTTPTTPQQRALEALQKLRENSRMSIDDTCRYGNIVLEAITAQTVADDLSQPSTFRHVKTKTVYGFLCPLSEEKTVPAQPLADDFYNGTIEDGLAIIEATFKRLRENGVKSNYGITSAAIKQIRIAASKPCDCAALVKALEPFADALVNAEAVISQDVFGTERVNHVVRAAVYWLSYYHFSEAVKAVKAVATHLAKEEPCT